MKLTELIERLTSISETWDGDKIEVVLAKDSEGNSYSPLEEIDEGEYESGSSWSGDFIPEWSDFPKAICFWPVN